MAGKEAEEKVRLGGMALGNGVLVHGPTSWACAVRTDDGSVKVVAERKKVRGAGVTKPLLRGPARLAESLAVLPRVKRALPEAKMPFEGRGTAASMAAAAIAMHGLRRTRLSDTAQELIGGVFAIAPAIFSLRGGSLASYHGAEHIAIGTYEHDGPATKEHERCGGHLVGPLIATTTIGNLLAARAPAEVRPAARLAASLGAVAASTEIFGWMQRNPDRRLSRALSKPGHELQHRLSTAEPSAEQLEVAQAALDACLKLEGA
jgi:uncharacterized protein YqhQ